MTSVVNANTKLEKEIEETRNSLSIVDPINETVC